MSATRSIVINCAGMGSRLGMGVPKSLVPILNKPIIQWQLETLNEVSEIIVVVGFKAHELANFVQTIRKDAIIVNNKEYLSTGTAGSFSLGAKIAGERVVSLDGDLLVNKSDIMNFLESNQDKVGVINPESSTPVYARISGEYVIDFSFDVEYSMEWSGLLSISKENAIKLGSGHVFEGLSKFLPLTYEKINCIEIDELTDLEKASNWIMDGNLYDA